MDGPDSKFFDSHAHLNSEKLSSWFELNSSNYESWVFNNVSINAEDLNRALEQSRKYKNVFVTVGIHPLEIDGLDLFITMKNIEFEIRNNPKIIALGETGLDFYRCDKSECYETQKEWFLAHYKLAQKYKLPLVLHVRSAHSEMLDILIDLQSCKGVIHCFEGDWNIAKKYLGLKGHWMLSASPIIFRSNSEFKGIIKNIDIKRLLVETDSPYLCENPGTIEKIVEFISKEKNLDFEVCKRVLWNNFRDFFGLN